MKQTDNHLFMQLIRIALGNATQFRNTVSDSEWATLLSMATKQGVVGITFSGVERLPKEQMPPLEVLMKWLAMIDYISRENRKINSVYAKVSKMLEYDRQHACFIKGASVGAMYPEPMRREPGDVDVWITGGYKAALEYANKRFPKVTGGDYGRHLEVKSDGALIEFHFIPAELYSPLHRRHMKQLYREIEGKPWNNRVTLDGSSSIIVPDLEDTLIIVFVHLFSHLAVEGIGMKQVVDCYWVLKEVAKHDTNRQQHTRKSAIEIRRRAMTFFRNTGISKFIAALMYVLQQIGMEEELMLCAPNAKLGKRLLNEILNTGVVSVEELVTGKYGKENKLHRFYRRLSRALRLMPIAPSEMLWMLNSGFFYWILRKRRI